MRQPLATLVFFAWIAAAAPASAMASAMPMPRPGGPMPVPLPPANPERLAAAQVPLPRPRPEMAAASPPAGPARINFRIPIQPVVPQTVGLPQIMGGLTASLPMLPAPETMAAAPAAPAVPEGWRPANERPQQREPERANLPAVMRVDPCTACVAAFGVVQEHGHD